MYCENCGNLMNNNSNFCSNCGVKANKPARRCKSCGNEVREYDTVCEKCGQLIEKNSYENTSANNSDNSNSTYTQAYNSIYNNPNSDNNFNQSKTYVPKNNNVGFKKPKSKIVAGILGILVGGLGIHRFYLGYIGIGIVQIVVSILTCGLGSLWGFIEGILILCDAGITADYDGNPLSDK